MTSPRDVDPDADGQLAKLARSLGNEDRVLLSPPADLWEDIAAGMDHGALPLAAGEDLDITDPAAISSSYRPFDEVMTQRRRRRSGQIGLMIAAAAAVVVGAVAIVASLGDDGADAELIATTGLEALIDGYGGGVELREADGRFQLDVDLTALPDAGDGYLELWLIKDLATGQMQSLGPIESNATVTLPEGLDPAAYSVVDISLEPVDGVPTHSGQSVLRGDLDL